MSNKKTTKRALGSSILALVLCFAMLLGTTYAWFTDSVTSANNIIKSGNLDIELEYWTEEGWKDVNKASDILTNTFWEPGVTEVAYLRVANAGSLALKYQLGINIVSETAGTNVAGEEFWLSDYIKFGVKTISADADKKPATYATREDAVAAVEAIAENELGAAKKISAGYTKATSMAPDEELYLALVVWMPTTVGNVANHNGTDVPEINLGINIFATQYTYEEDSYGKDYDDGAYIPVAPETVPEEPTAPLVLKGSAESKTTVTVPAIVAEALKKAGATGLSVEASAPVVDTTNKTVSFTTVELVDQNGNEVDIAATGAKVTVKLFVGDAFADGEQVEVYHDGSFVTYAKVENGYISYEVSHFCEVEIKAAEEVKLEIVENKTLTINTVKEFVAFAADVNAGNSYAGKTVVLGAELDLAGVTWTPIGTSANPFKGTFDGNGKVIKNLSVLMGKGSDVGLFGNTRDGEIKNVTVENAKVAGRLNVGVVAGTPYTSKYTNITVKGLVEVDGMAYVGAVGGKNAYADWTNITVDVDAKSYVNANSVENGKAYRTYVGGVVGFNGEGGHTFKNITTNINVIGSTCDVGGAFGIAHYGNKFENVTVTGTVTCTDATTEIGGVIGVWHNENGYTVTLTNCVYKGESNVALTGSAYKADGTGKLIVDGVEVVASAKTLQAQLDAATGDTTIKLFCNIFGDVTVTQKEGVNVVIDGNGYKYDGTIYIHGQARHNGAETLTIQNINFVTEGTKDFISSNSTGSVERYAHNVTVQNCTFTGDETFGAVGIRLRQAYNIKIENCTATKMHSLLQANSCSDTTITVNKCKITASKNGVAFNNTLNAVITNCEIESIADYGYGIRVDANGAYKLTAENNTISADAPVLLRKATGAYTATLTGNTLTSKTGYTVLATAADYEAGVTLTPATGALKVTVDGATQLFTTEELKAAVKVKDATIYLAANTTFKMGDFSVAEGVTLIGNEGSTITGTLTSTVKNVTIKNVYIKSGNAQRWAYASGTVLFENCTFHATSVYAIHYDGTTNADITYKNCKIIGWVAITGGHNSLTFDGCEIIGNGSYGVIRSYGVATIKNCTFDVANVNVNDVYQDGIHAVDCVITVENCTNVNGDVEDLFNVSGTGEIVIKP